MYKSLVLILLMMPIFLRAQYGDTDKKWVINGYLVNMQSVSVSENPFELPDSLSYLTKGDNNMYNLNTYFQNRLNIFWYANDKLTVSAQMRNRLIIGDWVRLDFTGQLQNAYKNSGNLLNPSQNIAVGNSYILNVAFDRIYAGYSAGNWDITVGKQRINWGKTFAFNPNDMFNTYAYFDIDYEEKPGTDAVRAMYYTGATSSMEFAASMDSASQVSAALKWNTNVWDYDFQFIGGTLKQEDLALGFGWSGYLKGASWRGELAWYQPLENISDTSGVMMLSTGLDYSLKSKWTLQAEVMFAKLAEGRKMIFPDVYAPPQSVKDLAVSPFQLLGSVMYRASPLSTLSLATICYPHPDIKGIFISPSWTYSVADNFTASFYWQYFRGYFPDAVTDIISKQSVNTGFLRVKYSF